MSDYRKPLTAVEERVIRALADPDAPWYGSDLVDDVGELIEQHHAALHAAEKQAREERDREWRQACNEHGVSLDVGNCDDPRFALFLVAETWRLWAKRRVEDIAEPAYLLMESMLLWGVFLSEDDECESCGAPTGDDPVQHTKTCARAMVERDYDALAEAVKRARSEEETR